jgi:hypothetical protein
MIAVTSLKPYLLTFIPFFRYTLDTSKANPFILVHNKESQVVNALQITSHTINQLMYSISLMETFRAYFTMAKYAEIFIWITTVIVRRRRWKCSITRMA